METYLALFEQAVSKQAELVGMELANKQARQAGLEVSPDGHVVSCMDDPQIVLLRLIKSFTADGNFMALTNCIPLINELLKNQSEEDRNAQVGNKTGDGA